MFAFPLKGVVIAALAGSAAAFVTPQVSIHRIRSLYVRAEARGPHASHSDISRGWRDVPWIARLLGYIAPACKVYASTASGYSSAILRLRTDVPCVGVFLDRASSTRGQWAAMRALPSVPLPTLCVLSGWHAVASSLFALRQAHPLCSRFWIPIALRHASCCEKARI